MLLSYASSYAIWLFLFYTQTVLDSKWPDCNMPEQSEVLLSIEIMKQQAVLSER